MGAALRIRQTQQLARQAGELGRLKVVRGPDMGSVFVLTAPRATVGRGDENDIVLSDLRASRKHCELVFANGIWSVLDAGSVNGIAVNGRASRGEAIKTRDTIALGETVLEFFAAEAGTLVLVAEPGSVEQIQEEQKNLNVQRARIQAMSRFGGLAKNVPRADKVGPMPDRRSGTPARGPAAQSDPKRLLMIGAAVLVGGYLFLSDGTPPAKPKPQKAADAGASAEDGFQGGDSSAANEAVERAADMFFRAGFREYRLGNFLRAKTQFENALQIEPGHRLAKIYLKDAEMSIDSEVKEHLDIGRKSLDSGKLSEAKGHFEEVMRLLFRDPQNPAYVEAHDQLGQVQKQQESGGDD